MLCYLIGIVPTHGAYQIAEHSAAQHSTAQHSMTWHGHSIVSHHISNASIVQEIDLEQVLDEAELIAGHYHAFPVTHGSHWKLPLCLCIPLQCIHTTIFALVQ